MRSLQTINNKNILIVVAHPDDETLWFFQSTQVLKQNNRIQIFCMTHAAVSKRGKELQSMADAFGLKVLFGHCEDTGFNKYLKSKEVEQAFIKIFSRQKFDLVITHPPHGGEKPHPHHIQIYLEVKKFSKFHNFKFCFFSEQKLLGKFNQDSCYFFNYDNKKYISVRLIESFGLINKDQHRFLFLFSVLKDIWFNFDRYIGFETQVDLNEKQKALLKFSSQEEVLKSYNAFYKKYEYLFIKTN